MPTIPTNNESPSVFDPLYEQLIKRFIGSGSDISDIAGLSGPLGIAAPLIAKAPLADKAIRNWILREYLEQQINEGPVKNVLEFAQRRYPRIMSHITSVDTVDELPKFLGKYDTTAQHLMMPDDVVENHGYTSMIKLAPKTIIKNKEHLTPDEAIADSFGHELTHAAQTIWNRHKLRDATALANSSVQAYEDDLFEAGARKGGENFKNKMFYPAASRKLKKPEPVPQQPEGAIDRILKLFTGE